MKKYKTICISDVHLGTRSCKADDLNHFLKHNDADTYFLVGDIIDGWRVIQGRWFWTKEQSKVVQRIFKISRQDGVRIIFIPGNHDAFLRSILKFNISFGNIELHSHYDYIGIDGKKYFITHGDLFDGITRAAPWLSFLGDRAYDMVLGLNNIWNYIRRKLGYGYWSVSQYLKHKVKKAVDFIFKFEGNLASYAKRKGYDGIICGHIHKAEIKNIDGIRYFNAGDWVESCTALAEHHDGHWEIITWHKPINESLE